MENNTCTSKAGGERFEKWGFRLTWGHDVKKTKPLPFLTRVCFNGGPSVSRTQHQRILVCVAFTTPWTMPSP